MRNLLTFCFPKHAEYCATRCWIWHSGKIWEVYIWFSFHSKGLCVPTVRTLGGGVAKWTLNVVISFVRNTCVCWSIVSKWQNSLKPVPLTRQMWPKENTTCRLIHNVFFQSESSGDHCGHIGSANGIIGKKDVHKFAECFWNWVHKELAVSILVSMADLQAKLVCVKNPNLQLCQKISSFYQYTAGTNVKSAIVSHLRSRVLLQDPRISFLQVFWAVS